MMELTQAGGEERTRTTAKAQQTALASDMVSFYGSALR